MGRGISIFKLRLHIFKSESCHRSSNIAMFIDFDKILLLMLPLNRFDLQFQCDHIELNLLCSLELFVWLETGFETSDD